MTSLGTVWVTVRADFSTLRAEMSAELARLARQAVTIRPTLDLTAFRAQYRLFEQVYLRDRTFNVTPQLGPGLGSFFGSITTTFTQINRISGRAGEQSGASFGRGFSAQWKLIVAGIAAAAPLLQPLVGVLGSILQAAGAVGAALPLAMSALAVSVGTLVLSFHNLSDAIKGAFSGDPTKKQREAFEKLAPAAKEFVGILLATRTQLKGFQTEVQQTFFVAFLGGFKTLVASPAIAQLRAAMKLMAKDAGEAGGAIAKALGDSAKSGQLATILGGIRGSFDQILALAGPLTKMFLTLAQFAQPLVDMLVNKLSSGLTQLTMLVEKSAANGALAKFFDEGGRALSQLMRLVVNVGSIFDSIFDGLTGGSNTFLESLSVVTGKFATFLESAQGQAILGLLADKLSLIGDVITGVLGPVLPLAIQLAQVISGALSGAIRELLPDVTEFLTLLVLGLRPILTALAPVFDRLVAVIVRFLEEALSEIAIHVGKVIPAIVDLAQALGPELIPLVEALGDMLMALLPLIPALSGFIIALLPTLKDLTPALIAIIQAVAWLAEGSVLLISKIVMLIGWFVEFGNTITAYRLVLDAVAAATIAAWDAVVSWWQTKIVPSFKSAVDAVTGFFMGFWNFTTALWASWKQTWEAALQWFRDSFVAPIQDLVQNRLPAAFRSGVDLIGFWWNALRDLAKAPVRFIIETVINKGIIGTFNTVAGFFGAKGVSPVNLPAGFAAGGQLPGYSDVDNMVATGPGGKAIALAGGEWVINARQSRKHNHLLHAINHGMEGFADGGIIGAITNPAGWVRDRVDGLINAVPGGGMFRDIVVGTGRKLVTSLIDWVKSKLSFGGGGGPGFGSWPSSPSAQRGDSGVWRSIVALIRSTGPLSGSFGNAYRPGDPLWHGSGRAVDWMGFNQDALATFLALRRPLELIHRTSNRDYAYTRGVNKGSFSSGLMEAHRNHIHIAMAKGGMLRSFDQGGAWPSGTLGANTSGRTEHVFTGSAMDRMERLLERIEAAVDRVGPAVGREINGGAATLRQMARAR